MRATGMKNGVLSHHLSGMERAGSISAVRGPRQSRFYPPSFPEADSRVVKALRRRTPRLIIESLVLGEPLAFREITDYVGRSPSTVSLYLSQLVDDGVVAASLAGHAKRYRLADRGAVDRLAEGCRPGALDGTASGFEDIINSL